MGHLVPTDIATTQALHLRFREHEMEKKEYEEPGHQQVINLRRIGDIWEEVEGSEGGREKI